MATQNESISVTADVFIEQLLALRKQIPETAPLTAEEKTALRRITYLTDPEFMQASIRAIGTSTPIQGLLGRTPEDVRKDLDDDARWRAAEREVRTMLQVIEAANLTRRHRLALTAHQTYQISRQLTRAKGEPGLAPHVADMQRLNKRTRRRAKAAPPTEAGAKPKTQ